MIGVQNNKSRPKARSASLSEIAGSFSRWRLRGAMIDLHYAPAPNGWKISIMLEELGLPSTVILVNIRAGEQFRGEFLAISPSNRIPAIGNNARHSGMRHLAQARNPIGSMDSGLARRAPRNDGQRDPTNAAKRKTP
jgi:hypothetical protein